MDEARTVAAAMTAAMKAQRNPSRGRLYLVARFRLCLPRCVFGVQSEERAAEYFLCVQEVGNETSS